MQIKKKIKNKKLMVFNLKLTFFKITKHFSQGSIILPEKVISLMSHFIVLQQFEKKRREAKVYSQGERNVFNLFLITSWHMCY